MTGTKIGLKISALAVAAVLALSACGSENNVSGNDAVAVCTQNGVRVDDSRCGGSDHSFIWYYMMANMMMPSYHQRVYGGYWSPPSNHRVFYGGAPRNGGKINYSKFKPIKSSTSAKKSWFGGTKSKTDTTTTTKKKSSWLSNSGSSSKSRTGTTTRRR